VNLQVWVGGEAVLGKGIGLDAEIGAVARHHFADSVVGVFSPMATTILCMVQTSRLTRLQQVDTRSFFDLDTPTCSTSAVD
jgi:hypothetical protein